MEGCTQSSTGTAAATDIPETVTIKPTAVIDTLYNAPSVIAATESEELHKLELQLL